MVTKQNNSHPQLSQQPFHCEAFVAKSTLALRRSNCLSEASFAETQELCRVRWAENEHRKGSAEDTGDDSLLPENEACHRNRIRSLQVHGRTMICLPVRARTVLWRLRNCVACDEQKLIAVLSRRTNINRKIWYYIGKFFWEFRHFRKKKWFLPIKNRNIEKIYVSSWGKWPVPCEKHLYIFLIWKIYTYEWIFPAEGSLHNYKSGLHNDSTILPARFTLSHSSFNIDEKLELHHRKYVRWAENEKTTRRWFF